jgi:hypothetical protein
MRGIELIQGMAVEDAIANLPLVMEERRRAELYLCLNPAYALKLLSETRTKVVDPDFPVSRQSEWALGQDGSGCPEFS